MSYSDIISVVSNIAPKMFNERLNGQKIQDNFRKTNLMQTINTNMIQSSKQQNLENGQHLNFTIELSLLRKQIHELFLFLAKENIYLVCLNGVKKWQKRFAQEKKFTKTEAKGSSCHGSVIIAKMGIRSKRLEQLHPGRTLTDRH